MPQIYNKPHLSYEDQLALLVDKGMKVTDAKRATECLERIGYYRLKPYWLPFENENGNFHVDAEFHHVVDLYVFDKRLRLTLLDAIERIEVAIRVDLAHCIGIRDVWGHRLEQHLDQQRAGRFDARAKMTNHAHWLLRADESENSSKEPWVKDYRAEYLPPLPLWMAVELWDFGTVSRLLQMAHPNDRHKIAKKYMVLPDTLISWVRCLNYVRNACAHHARVWNKPLVDQPMIPKTWEAKLAQHIGAELLRQTRVYGAAAIARYLLTIINPNSQWHMRFIALWHEFPDIPNLGPENAGFFDGWEIEELWK